MAEWVVLELSSKADNEDPEIVRASIRHLLRDADIFVPASIVQQGDERVVKYLLEGYAFIRRAHPDERYFRLEGSKYITSIVTAPSAGMRSRRVACVQDKDIDRFRSQIHIQEDQGICVGDMVSITSGPYKNLKAIVIEDIPEEDAVQVHVQLRSKDSLVTLPRAFLRLVEKAAKPPYHAQKEALRSWVEAALSLAHWQPSPHLGRLFQEWLRLHRVISVASQVMTLTHPLDGTTLQVKGEEYARILRWFEGVRSRFQTMSDFDSDFEPSSLVSLHERFQRMTRWAKRTNNLAPVVFSLYDEFSTSELEQKYGEWVWLGDAFDRLLLILGQLERIERQMASGGVQNLIIDGHNLAIRCASAPGLGELKDKQGRPTGAIVGFLSTLSSLKKRFDGVDIYVTWDGSSQRRKKMFSGYKEGRGNPKAAFETSWLQEHLPSFGVHQAWNRLEEADDAIATLVRGRLDGQSNIIFTNDRDLLQLVTASTCVLIPAVGGGKEKLFGVSEVEAEYGVPPSMMPQLRALAGDVSDTIPGCPNCGLKTAMKLIKLYGTADKLLASNMAGLAKGLTTNLRNSETQVRLNVLLMTLIPDLDLMFVGAKADEGDAVGHLQEVDVRPDRFLPTFFGIPAAP